MTHHAKSRDGVKFPCTFCTKSFTPKDNRDKRIKIVHHEGRVAVIQDMQAGPSNAVTAEPANTAVAGPSNERPTLLWTSDEENDEQFMQIDTDDYEGKNYFIMVHHMNSNPLCFNPLHSIYILWTYAFATHKTPLPSSRQTRQRKDPRYLLPLGDKTRVVSR